MKKIIVITLTVALLFTGVGTTASAANSCSHSHTTYQYDEWRPTGNGYNHPYTTASGTKGCGVTIMEKYRVYKCNSCAALILIGTGTTWESHEETSHNGPKP